MALLLSEKVPYVLTVFVAALGFAVSQTLDRYNRVPTIEYSVEKMSILGDVAALDGAAKGASGPTVFLDRLPPIGQAGFVLTLRNISPTHVVRCLRVDVALLPRVGGPSPAISNWVTSTSASAPVKRRGAEQKDRPGLTVIDMQPGTWIDLRMNASNVGDFSVIPRACSTAELEPDSSGGDLPVVKKRSFETVFVQYALEVFWVGVAAWSVLLVIALLRKLRPGMKHDA